MNNFVRLTDKNGEVLRLNLNNIVGVNEKRCIVYTTGDIIIISQSMMAQLVNDIKMMG